MKKIFISSPLKPYSTPDKSYTLENNINIAKQFCREVILEGDNPLAPHVYYTQFLNDENEAERLIGFINGLELLSICDQINVYKISNYISWGMSEEIKYAERNNIKINYIEISNPVYNTGCDYCNANIILLEEFVYTRSVFNNSYDNCNFGVFLDKRKDNTYLRLVDTDDCNCLDSGDSKIVYFCPMCGRKL